MQLQVTHRERPFYLKASRGGTLAVRTTLNQLVYDAGLFMERTAFCLLKAEINLIGTQKI